VCQRRFTTYEIIEVLPLIVIKKDGKRQEFDPAKIMAGLIKSCYKRPVSTEQMQMLVNEIHSDLLNSMTNEIAATDIGHMIMNKLRELDEISYVRFASVYLEFKDVETLMHEIQLLTEQK
jgi:transcriptional repressor NrdR